MLYIVSGAMSGCCILSQELGVGAVYCLRSYEWVLYIVSGARGRCCILSQELGVGALYFLWS